MKRLAVLRHAKSSWDHPGIEDFDRRLSERGWKVAKRMGLELKHRALKFDLVLASTAARVRETIEGLQEELEINLPVRFDPRIYGADQDQLLAIIRELPETVDRPLIVGHNPGLALLLAKLTADEPEKLRELIADKFPAGAFAIVQLPSHRWANIEPLSGMLAELILPEQLD